MAWRHKKLFALLAVAAIGLVAGDVASAQVRWPKMSWQEYSPTFAEHVADADAFVVAQWVAINTNSEDAKRRGCTEYTIKEIVSDSSGDLSVGQKVGAPWVINGKAGDLSVLFGTKSAEDKKIVWQFGGPATETSIKYILQAPSPDIPIGQQLEYYVTFLDSSDPFIGYDIHAVFANAPLIAIKQLGKKLTRQKVFQRLTSDDTPATRIGLYGLMIGVCGNQDDAKYLKEKILEPTKDYRIGIDGLMCGYLLLTGDKGLDVLDEAKIRNKDAPFIETYAAMQTLRFMWEHGEEKIKPERLRQSMRILLERYEITDLVISDLVRWKDWSIQDKLMKMYGEGDFNIPPIKRAIARYMLLSTRLPTDATADAKVPEHIERGRKYVEELRQKDLKTVSEVERLFNP